MGFATLLPAIYTIILWWFTTGIIIAVYRRTQGFKRLYFAGATVALGVALVGLYLTREVTHVTDVYVAATCGIVIWGWQIASYYLGFITGPFGKQVPDSGWNRSLTERFRLALYFSIYHEVLSVATAGAIALLTWSGGNHWGFWMYVALWFMHASAKLNVFLGVRNFRIDILPNEMQHLSELLGKRHSNALFPFSILIASAIVVVLVYQGFTTDSSMTYATGVIMIATMMALGILEHWMLVLPLPSGFWSFGNETGTDQPEDVDTRSKAYKAAPEVSGD